MSLFSMSIPVMGLITGLASVAFADSITFTPINDPLGLGNPGNVGEFVFGINDAGQMVGAYLGNYIPAVPNSAKLMTA